ncbi:MAG: glycosyltransferase [Gemmataceae bacterium]|nr:glycosyltransferase [Gemmataceae bacterium]
MVPALKLDFPVPSEADRGYVGGGDFLKIAEDFRDLFVRLGGLKPNQSVLDVGCGIGRMALGLVHYMDPNARYEGFDIVKHGIDWCKENITPRWPNFSFQHSDIYNKYYNPKGRLSPRSYKFPYADGSFDFVFLTSVFTHMVQHDMDHYLSEIHRVLRQGGKVFITFFLINPEAQELIAAGKSVFQFQHHRGPCWYEFQNCPEQVIGYDEKYLRELFQVSGFGPDLKIWPGSWVGRASGETSHDLLLAVKQGEPTPAKVRKRKWVAWIPGSMLMENQTNLWQKVWRRLRQGGISALLRSLGNKIRQSKLGKTLLGPMETQPSPWRKAWRRLRLGGISGLVRSLGNKIRQSKLGKTLLGPTGPWSKWLRHYLPTPEQLEKFRKTKWGINRPKFSLVMPVYNPRPEWLIEAIASVRAQTYAEWELICVDDGSPNARISWILQSQAAEDTRVHALLLGKNHGVSGATNAGIRAAGGTHILFMDHDDYLEPHALHRFAQSIEEHNPDFMYADEALTSEDLDHVHLIKSCPMFSHDYYLSHPYFVHPVCARAEVVKAAGLLDPKLRVSHDVDMVLRMLEASRTVAHIPDILYRWRLHAGSASHCAALHEVTVSTQGALERHLNRLGTQALVSPALAHHNFFRIDYPLAQGTRVAILIPNKNRADLLSGCLASLEKTLPKGLADIVLIDHESDDPAAVELLQQEAGRYQIVRYSGPFNFAAMMNLGVRSLTKGKYSHYLFLNNDTVAAHPGWLEHLAGLAQRPSVAAAGATLLYPDHTIQHAGVILGLAGPADHSHKFFPFGHLGMNGSLQATRAYSAVTAACMIVQAPAFHAVGGFDETLAVGFNDTDLCLRLREKGWEIVQTPHAALFHLESQSRLADRSHTADNARFVQRHAHLLASCDPYFSPYLDHQGFTHEPAPDAHCPDEVSCREIKTPWSDKVERDRSRAA